MAHQLDVARSRDVVARWCVLAEQRLEHLTEMFESGRWRRYHTERAFLENLQEAKAAVQTWRDLSIREASLNNSAIDMSWLGHTTAALPRREGLRDELHQPQSQPAEIPAEPLPSDVLIVLADNHVSSDEAPSAPAMDSALELTLGIAAAIAERYPLLRNTL